MNSAEFLRNIEIEHEDRTLYKRLLGKSAVGGVVAAGSIIAGFDLGVGAGVLYLGWQYLSYLRSDTYRRQTQASFRDLAGIEEPYNHAYWETQELPGQQGPELV